MAYDPILHTGSLYRTLRVYWNIPEEAFNGVVVLFSLPGKVLPKAKRPRPEWQEKEERKALFDSPNWFELVV